MRGRRRLGKEMTGDPSPISSAKVDREANGQPRFSLLGGSCPQEPRRSGRRSTFLYSQHRWAERAARLGSTAAGLFGCSPAYPVLHLSCAGRLWILNGGQIIELHRDW